MPVRLAGEFNCRRNSPFSRWWPSGSGNAVELLIHYQNMRSINVSAIKVFFLSCLFTAFSGCNLIYEQDVQQGNVLNDEMLDNLEQGMSKTEVQYYIGTPLIEDPFHANRWDYFYAYREGGENKTEHRIITLLFDEQDRLADITGSAETTEKPARDVTLPEEGNLNAVISDIDQDDGGFWQSLKQKILR